MLFAAFCAACGAVPVHAQQWTQPTPEELSMTTQPEVPGAAAVYLYREQTTDDLLHMQSFYVRLKVLTEKGKESANVSLGGGQESGGYAEDVTDIAGRTIHSDGTVVAFTGKPYQRTVEKTKDLKLIEKVFTLPDVEVGSIIEYRYKRRIPDDYFSAPHWDVQQSLFVRREYFFWKSVDEELVNSLTDEISEGIAWSSVLPAGAAVKSEAVPNIGNAQPFHRYSLEVHDVMPEPEEDYMPPLHSFTFRVNFYFAYNRSQQEYWKTEGRAWQKDQDHFIGSPGSLKDAVQSLVAAGDTDTVKLQKIYAAVMKMDNTSYSRMHNVSEDKARGLKDIKTVQDIWQRKSGVDDQLTQLFVGLARAAGLKAYVMRVTNRDENMFSPAWLTLGQLNDDIAIVTLDGKEQFFDPGQRDCPFGQLAWKHTGTGGLREMDGGAGTLATTPEPPYLQSQTQRIADLTLDADGTAHGSIKITWTGSPALEWRQQALSKDEEEMKHSMREWLQSISPDGMEPSITTVENLDDYEKPLIANFTVRGPLATVTAKRLILPSEFFEAQSKPLFPHPTRDIAIYFEHGGRVSDAMRVKFPDELQAESVPKEDTFMMKNLASYHVKPEVQGNAVVVRRTYDLGTAFFLPKEYSDVKSFYDKVAVDDQQPVLLLNPDASAAPATEKKTGNDKSN